MTENVHNARSEVTTSVASAQHSFHVAPMKGALVGIAFSFTFLTCLLEDSKTGRPVSRYLL